MSNSPLEVYRIVVSPRHEPDPRAAGYLANAHALGIRAVERIECHDLYFIEGQVRLPDLQRIATELLSDPIVQSAQWGRLLLPPTQAQNAQAPFTVEVALRPGVTDPVAEQIVRAAAVLGIQGISGASTGLRFRLDGATLTLEDVQLLTQRLLANPTIQRHALGEIEAVFPHPAQGSGQVEGLPLRELDEAGLLALSRQRRAALDLAEMQAVQAYYRGEGREPTDVELETIAQTWSEHCVHKTFKARIEVSDGRDADGSFVVNGLLKTYLRAATEQIAAPWVRSAFVDNAGILDFDDEYEVSFKVETHNHPSAIEPFGGANTGVGGVIRDVLGVSAKPIAATDVLCFGPQELDLAQLPEGVLHPRRIQAGVVAGVQDYGNKIGIPTVNGAILYDPGYTANPLVFCGCVGLAPKDSHPRAPQPGDRVIVLGGRTGRDGLRGATFSSMTMDAQTGAVAGASVQIGDPITEKGLIEVIVRARDARLYHAITDCGAGGLSSAIGEMSSSCGADVELQDVPLKYPGLAPWEIWLSEAQERMVLAVPPAALEALRDLCRTYDVELSDLGAFNDSGRLVVRYASRPVLDLANDFLHEGIPQRHLKAVLPPAPAATQPHAPAQGELHNDAVLLQLLAHPDIASKAATVRIYDHEVQGGTAIKPLTGIENDGPADGAVLKPFGTRGRRGIALSNGVNPQYGKLDAYRMAWSVIDEAVRNAVAVGGDPARLAILDNFCWGDPLRPETLGALVQAAQGCRDAALHYQAPFISGKDSLNNEYLGSDGLRHAIPPTLLISAIAMVEDVSQAVSMDLKAPGNALYLAGSFQPAWGGSRLALMRPEPAWQARAGGPVPEPPAGAPQVYAALHAAMRAGLVRACHDLSEGGLAVAAAEMCIGGRLGLEISLAPLSQAGAGEQALLFGESNGCLLVEVRPGEAAAFEAHFAGLPLARLGTVQEGGQLRVRGAQNAALLDLPVSDLVQAWNGETR